VEGDRPSTSDRISVSRGELRWTLDDQLWSASARGVPGETTASTGPLQDRPASGVPVRVRAACVLVLLTRSRSLARRGVHANDRATSRQPGAREGEIRTWHPGAMDERL
jgi:hypothetical protein